MVVAVAFVTMAIGVNARTAFSLLFPPILEEFGWERGVTAGAFALGFALSMMFTPVLGRAMDWWGPKAVMPIGVAMMATGLLGGTLIREPWHLYPTLGVLVAGGSVVLGYTGHALFLPNWFVRRRGMALGIAFSGVGVGAVVLFPWLQSLILRYGWRSACWAMAALMVLLVPINVWLQRRRPGEIGLEPDGEAVHAVRQGQHADNVVDRAWASTEWTLARAAATARFWWLAVGFFAGLFTWYAVQVHQTKYLIEIGYPPSTAAWALGLVPLVGIVGQIGLGHLSDRVGREWAWTLSAAGFAACYALLIAMRTSPTPALLYLMVIMQGALGYGLASVWGAIPAEIFQGKHYGTVFGCLGLASGLGSGAGPWIAGLLYDRTGSYTPAFMLAIGFCALSALAIWMASPRKVRVVAGRVARLQATRAGAARPPSTTRA